VVLTSGHGITSRRVEETMAEKTQMYAARLRIDYPDTLDRVTTLLRAFWIIPIAIILTLITASGGTRVVAQTGETVRTSGGGILGGVHTEKSISRH
jgi:hypothetical protein